MGREGWQVGCDDHPICPESKKMTEHAGETGRDAYSCAWYSLISAMFVVVVATAAGAGDRVAAARALPRAGTREKEGSPWVR